jgi:precorrin-6Y C5,15-methyltransferase (decarboxylating) CbiT subunit
MYDNEVDYRGAFLPDSAYDRGAVPMTKEEVRWLSLLKLKIAPDHTVLDIGAGTGSVAVGAALLAHRGQVVAVEKHPEALSLIAHNAEKAGVRNLRIVAGTAPEALNGLGDFDCIFIGGSGGHMAALIDWCARHLRPGGRLVLNTVTLENTGESIKQMRVGPFDDIEVIQIAIARGRAAGSLTLMEAQNPVMMLSATRRKDER